MEKKSKKLRGFSVTSMIFDEYVLPKVKENKVYQIEDSTIPLKSEGKTKLKKKIYHSLKELADELVAGGHEISNRSWYMDTPFGRFSMVSDVLFLGNRVVDHRKTLEEQMKNGQDPKDDLEISIDTKRSLG